MINFIYMMRNSTSLFLVFVFFFSACNQGDCDQQLATCSEEPPKGELCQAIYERYFYTKERNQCEMITYKGCSQAVFDSKTACEACLCN